MPTLARWLFGAESPCGGQGSDYAIEHTATWPAWVMLLLVLAASAWVVVNYGRERRGVQRVGQRLACRACGWRSSVLAAVMFYGWLLRPYCTDLPDVVVILDDSASMLENDHYDDAELRSRVAQRLQAANLNQSTRFELAKALLLQNDAKLLDELDRRYNLKLFHMAAGAEAVASQGAAFDEQVRGLHIDPDSKEASRSLLGKGLRHVLEAQRGRPTAAIIAFTDGVTTEGKTLGETAEYARRKAIPLFLYRSRLQPPAARPAADRLAG